MWVEEPKLEKNKGLKGKTIGQLAKEQGKGVIDAFLDLVVEEKLETEFMQAEINVDDEAMKQILTHPNAIVGLSDGGAHVQFHGGYGYCTRLLSEWVREKQIMTLEHAVRRLTFDSASALGLYDRGLLRPGMNADVVIFDPDTVKPAPGKHRSRLPGERLAREGAGAGHQGDDRQRRSPAGGRQVHGRAVGQGGAQHVLQRAQRLSRKRGEGSNRSRRQRSLTAAYLLAC